MLALGYAPGTWALPYTGSESQQPSAPGVQVTKPSPGSVACRMAWNRGGPQKWDGSPFGGVDSISKATKVGMRRAWQGAGRMLGVCNRDWFKGW